MTMRPSRLREFSGKTLYVPRVDPARAGHMDFLQVHGESDLQALPAGLWGIREPDLVFDNEARANGAWSE